MTNCRILRRLWEMPQTKEITNPMLMVVSGLPFSFIYVTSLFISPGILFLCYFYFIRTFVVLLIGFYQLYIVTIFPFLPLSKTKTKE